MRVFLKFGLVVLEQTLFKNFKDCFLNLDLAATLFNGFADSGLTVITVLYP